MNGTKKSKPIRNIKDWIKIQYINNLISIIIEILILAGLYFYILRGSGSTNQQALFIQIFFLLEIPKATIQIPVTGLTRIRNEFLRGKWEITDIKNIGKKGQIKSPWKFLGAEALLIGIGTAIPISFISFLINDKGKLSSYSASIIIFIITLVLSTLLVKRRYLTDIALFSDSLKLKQARSDNFSKYLLGEHITPWTLIAFLATIVINLKNYAERSLNLFGYLSIMTMPYDIAVTAFVIMYWICDASQNQVRPDVNLGRLKSGRPLPTIIFLLLLNLIPFAILGGAMGIFSIIGWNTFLTMYEATVITSMAAAVAAIAACWLGVWWGKVKEYAWLKKR